jgi:hypothetical protein
MYVWAKLLGITTAGSAMVIALATLRRAFGPAAARRGAWFLAAACIVPFQALNGLETGVAVLVVTGMAAAVVRFLDAEPPVSRRWTAVYGVLWLLGGMTRPEVVLYGLIAAAPMVLASRERARTLPLREDWPRSAMSAPWDSSPDGRPWGAWVW